MLDEKTKETFCAAPFMQLLLQPTGVISPCCWNQAIDLGNVQDKSFDEIWNGEMAQKLREEFLSGNVKLCETQVKHIQCHKHFERFLDQLDFSVIQKTAPRRFDVRLNGRCNLSCVMCDVWEQPNGLYEKSFFWEKGPTEIFPNLIEMDVLGGEPFVQPDTFKLIDQVSEVNKTCKWAFVTNASYTFSKAIKSRLDKIDIRWIQISMDSLDPDTYAKIRLKGKHDQIMETLEKYLEYRSERASAGRPFALTASMCVLKDNWREMPEFLDFCKEHSITPIYQYAFEPEDCSLTTLPQNERERIADFIQSSFSERDMNFVRPILSPLEESLR